MTELRSDWPREPYKGLAHYGPDDRPLFTGRDQDVDVCIHFLAAPETRMLLLHGQTGCGKSSFLRAGLIPSLEERAFGYFFLRDSARAPLFIRCGPDPLGRIAEHLFRFASQPVHADSVKGDHAYDVTAACLEYQSVKDYVDACRRPGVLMRSLQMLSKALPFTLVIILDQAEEVITLAEGNSDDRRQFFRFVREFSTTNFPLKFVLALRKDNSGEFIGLAQIGGSLELPPLVGDPSPAGQDTAGATKDRPSGASESADRPVKSDIKIFLLSELTRDEVLQAIVLPTSKTPVDGRTAPFNTYHFDYAPDVAETIVRDIFEATSSTAVLPVMQIACRDLYTRATKEDDDEGTLTEPAARRDRPKPWRIDRELYDAGGGISGPVDRHVSRSLVASFGSMVPEGETKDEERLWREILFRLVRRESDGTVHTNIVSLAQLRAIVDEFRPRARLDDVVEYLTQPNILLLRSVTVLSADDPEEGRFVSLGHDFIGMVLQRWKVRHEEAEAARGRIVRYAKRAGWAVLASAAVLGTLFYVGYRELEQGQGMSKQAQLLKTAKFLQREEPMLAMLAAVRGTRVATDLHNNRLGFGTGVRDTQADEVLANMLAALPRKTQFTPETPLTGPDLGTNDSNVALPKSNGFINIGKSRAEIVTDAMMAATRQPFELDAIAPPDRGSFPPQTSIAIGEPRPGTVLVMRTISTGPVRDLASSSHQLIVFSDGRKVGHFDADFFRNFGGQAGAKPTVVSNDKRGTTSAMEDLERYSREGFTSLELTGSVVVLYTFRPPGAAREGSLKVEAFAYDERRSPYPFRRDFTATLPWESNNPLGLTAPLFVDGFLLVPASINGEDAGAPVLVRYDLRRRKREDGQGVALNELAQAMQCPAMHECKWQLIPRREPGPLLVFGSLKSSNQLGRRSIEQVAQADIDNFDRFAIADASTGRATSLAAAELRADRSQCTGHADVELSGDGGPAIANPVFMSGTLDTLFIGFPSAHSVDVLRFAPVASVGKYRCVGALMIPADEISQWSVSADASTLLGVGRTSGAVWDVQQTVGERATEILAKGHLTELACASGLKDYRPDPNKWMAATYLDPEPDACRSVAAASSVSTAAASRGRGR